MRTNYLLGLLAAVFVLFMQSPAALAADKDPWIWLSSNDKYSKFYAPSRV